jgi:myo-inositol-hexaphosphate 3-phosphohydrolase
LIDLNGNLLKILFDGFYSQEDLKFDISFVASGIYILKANQNNTLKTFKIIKGK